jgi:ribokinase
MRLAVVGHVEWAEILHVERLPRPGGFAEATLLVHEVAGAGAIAARQLAKLGGRATLFTKLADDERGRQAREELVGAGVKVEALFQPGMQRRAFVHVDEAGERTITVHGEKLCPAGSDPLPWAELEEADGVFFVCGDEAALVAARRARVLVATSRWLPTLRSAGLHLDALVGSADDPAEAYSAGDLEPPPGLVVATAGAKGGTFTTGNGAARMFPAAPVEGGERDAYACGDSFAGGLTFALARGDTPEQAVAFAARCGAACFAGAGLSGQLQIAPAPY